MNFRRTAGFVVVGGAVAALLAGAATPARRVPDATPVRQPPTIDLHGAALAAEISRLQERLRPTAAPRRPARNLFSFGSVRRSDAAADPPVAALPEPVATTLAEAFDVALVGIAEDAGPNGPVRTAILSVSGELVLAGVDTDVSGHRVIAIEPDAVELAARESGRTIRLRLN